jgi:CRISPR-associated endonuclease/helicase Cas3
MRFHSASQGNAPESLAELACRHEGQAVRVLVYVRSPKAATEVAAHICKKIGRDAVAMLTGTIRGYERDLLTADPGQIESEGARKRAELFRSFHAAPDRGQPDTTLYLVATSAGEVGVDLDADHMICDLSTLDSMIQRLGRVNRLGREVETFVAEIDVVDVPPEKEKGEESAEGSDRRERVERTRDVLRPADSDGRDVGPRAMRELVDGLSDEQRKACFSKTPVTLELTDVLLDGWAMTSVENLPGRPLVERWLHGVTSEPPSTYVAWREEVDHVVDATVPDGALEKLFDEYPVLAAERVRGNRQDVVDELKRIVRRAGEDRVAVLVPPRGEPSVERLGELVRKENEDRLREATVVLPPDVGGLDDSGMLDGSKDKFVRDVADAPVLRKGGRDEPAAPDRMRVLMTLDPETETWVARLLGTDETFDCPVEGSRKAAREVRKWALLDAMCATARIVLETDDDGAETKALLLFARRGTADAIERSQEAAREVPLASHNREVRDEASRLIRCISLPPELEPFGKAIVLAAKRHDLGKDRSGWQKAIGNPPKKDGWTPLAKSGKSGFDNSACGEYRHEFGSLREAASHVEICALDDLERELALHVIAAHHGWARPHFEARHWDIAEGVGDEENATLCAETMRRYARLQRRFGRWGLAWLESLLRAADHRVSAHTDEGSTEPSAPKTSAL